MNVFGSDEEQSSQRLWNGDRIAPIPALNLSDLFQVSPTDPQDYGLGSDYLRASPLQERSKLTESSGTGVIERRDVFCDFLETIHKHADIGKFKITRDFRQERCLLDI